MKAIERVKQYIDFKGFNNSFFEKENELSNGYIATQLKRNADLGEGVLNKILDNCLEINPEWLLTGNGKMLKQERVVAKTTNTKKGIPMLPFDAFAGIGDSNLAGVNFDVIEERYDVPLFYGLKIDFMIPVRGSSMYPKYSSGDVVACMLITDLLFIQWNKVYVIDSISQGIIMKRLLKADSPEKVICRSDNKDYGDFNVLMNDIRNIALVVGVVRLE